MIKKPTVLPSKQGLRQLVIESITLQTARGRLAVFIGLSAIIFVCRYHWLDHLSLWGNLGFTHAPSVGLTRAYWLILHGDLVAAWHRNWLIYVVLSVGLPLLANDARKLARRNTYPSNG